MNKRAWLLTLLVSSTAHAEVMDKEPTLLAIWVWCGATVALGALGYAYRFPLGLIATLPGTLFAVGMEQELREPFVGPAIIAEAGSAYAMQVHALVVAIVGVHVFGLVMARRRRSRSRPCDAA